MVRTYGQINDMEQKERIRMEFRASRETKKRLEALARMEENGNKSAWLKRRIDEAWDKIK